MIDILFVVRPLLAISAALQLPMCDRAPSIILDNDSQCLVKLCLQPTSGDDEICIGPAEPQGKSKTNLEYGAWSPEYTKIKAASLYNSAIIIVDRDTINLNSNQIADIFESYADPNPVIEVILTYPNMFPVANPCTP